MTSGYISVLTCTRNRGSAAARCVKSLSLQDYPASLLEIAVLDDASTDGSPAQLREALAGLSSSGWSRTQLFINPENMQIAAGRSFLEQKVSPEAEFVCFVDDDAELRGLDADDELHGLDDDPELRGFDEGEELRGLNDDMELRGLDDSEDLRGFDADQEMQGMEGYVRQDGVNGLEAFVPQESPQTRRHVTPAQAPEVWKSLW